MSWIIVFTHGKFGEELINSAEMILGKIEDIYSYSLMPSEPPEEFMGKVLEEVSKAPKGSIILTDLFGGTPSNVAAAISKKYGIESVAGLNLPMLIEVEMRRKELGTENFTIKLVEESQKSIISITEEMKTRKII